MLKTLYNVYNARSWPTDVSEPHPA